LSCANEGKDERVTLNNPDYDKAYESLDLGQVDSAFLYFSQAKDLFIELNDSLHTANCFINMAIIQKDKGDYYGAQETALQGSDFLNKSNPKHRIYLSTNFNTIAVATQYLQNNDEAILYYKEAIRFSDDSLQTNIYRNNLAISYVNTKQYLDALELYEQILKEVQSMPREYARVITNRARAKWLMDPKYNAYPELLKALKIREQEGDLWGQNSSLAHLVDYYVSTNVDSALYYARRRYDVSKKIDSSNDEILALSKLIDLSPSDSVKGYFEIYSKLKDSVQTAREVAKNQFALIRYEVEKNKANNLLLEMDNVEKQNRLTRQYFVIAGIVIIFVILTLVGIIFYKKRKQALRLEAQNQIKESKLKTSRKVHDVVANGIYRVMTEIEYTDELNRDSLLDKLEDMYHKSRDISYEAENQPEDLEELENIVDSVPTELLYHEHITSLTKSFANDTRRVLTVGNEAVLWQLLSEKDKDQLYQVLQELLVNMDKHSEADNVVLRFQKDNDYLSINYSDDGIGMKQNSKEGNGLINMRTRVNNLNGTILFTEDTFIGLKIEIKIPIL